MSKLLMLKGLPASGKSTYANKLVDKGWKRFNKDDLRLMVDAGKWSRHNEELIRDLEVGLAMIALNEGHNVVIDDTNFAYESLWKELAERHNSNFEVNFFDIPLYECIERDSKRGDKSVGAKVIQGMYDRYLKPELVFYPESIDCYIADIDGTLAHTTNRSPYDYTKVSSDTVDVSVKRVINSLRLDAKIIIMSGRDSVCREETIAWLNDNGVKYDELYMRPQGDKRKDAIVKKELYEKHVRGKYNVLGVFDDRNQVVDLWRSLGLKCFQVHYGFF